MRDFKGAWLKWTGGLPLIGFLVYPGYLNWVSLGQPDGQFGFDVSSPCGK